MDRTQALLIQLCLIAIVSLIVFGFIIIHAHGETNKNICVLQPWDLTINSRAVTTVENYLVYHKMTYTHVDMIDQLLHKIPSDCSITVKFERFNNNGFYLDSRLHYDVFGSTIILYTNVTPVVFPNTDQHLYGFKTCILGVNCPMARFENPNGDISPYIIQSSLEKALQKLITIPISTVIHRELPPVPVNHDKQTEHLRKMYYENTRMEGST
jgi:hypothetical protein